MNGLDEYQIVGLVLMLVTLCLSFGTLIGVAYRIFKPFLRKN